VLQNLPPRFATVVFSKLTDSSGSLVKGCERALHLPKHLLSHWMASTPAVLDLRTAKWTALQWSRLFDALLQGGRHLTEFHTRLVRSRSGDSRVAEVPLDSARSCLQQCRNFAQEYRHYSLSDTVSTEFKELIDTLESLINDGVKKRENARNSAFKVECVHMLRAFAGVLPQLTTLQHVGLHNLPLQTQLIPALGQVLMSFPPSVTTLTLTTAASVETMDVGLLLRSMLFKAIALVKNLRELHIPNWEDIVGRDEACLEPLYQLPRLETVYVTKVKNSSAFPEQLAFKEE
jgi:hypothetical protein